MTQISPPVARAVAVLNFLAEHPEESFTLSEIAKSLRISSATCHNLLISLSETGYVFRTAGKTYLLGPALARVAQAAFAPAAVMQVVRPEMRLLADEFDVVCSVSQLVGQEIIIRERASALSHLDWHEEQLLTAPTTYPSGGMFLAWDEAELERWLCGGEPVGSIERSRVKAGLAFLRERAFTFGVRKAPLSSRAKARELQNRSDLTDHFQSAPQPDAIYHLAYVAAPAFSAPGRVALMLSLTGFAEPVDGKRLEQMASKLRIACERIGLFLAGRDA